MPIPDSIAQAEYISLATFRKSGVSVPTPVWAAESDGALYIFSESKAGKVKRLRNSPKAQVAICGMRGELKGEWMDAQGFLVDSDEEVARAYVALKAKYGWKMTLTDLGSKLTGRYHKRTILRVEMDSMAGCE